MTSDESCVITTVPTLIAAKPCILLNLIDLTPMLVVIDFNLLRLAQTNFRLDKTTKPVVGHLFAKSATRGKSRRQNVYTFWALCEWS
jgi:hypothetical protein